MKIKEFLTKSVSAKIWIVLLIMLVCFFFGSSTGSVEYVEVEKIVEKIVEKPVERIVKIPATCDKEKKIIGLYDDVLNLDNEAFTLLGAALEDPFNSYTMGKATDRVNEIADEKNLKLLEIMTLDN